MAQKTASFSIQSPSLPEMAKAKIKKQIPSKLSQKNTTITARSGVKLPAAPVVSHNHIDDESSKIDKLEKKLRISVQECYSYRGRMESAIKHAEELDRELSVYKSHVAALEAKLKEQQDELAVIYSKPPRSFSLHSVVYGKTPVPFRVSEIGARYWSLVRHSVKLHSFISKGILSQISEEKVFLGAVARQAGDRQKLLLREVYKLLVRYRTLTNISNAMSRETNLDVAIKLATSATYEILGCDRVALYMVDHIRNELECKFSKDGSGWRIPMGKGIAGECASKGEIFNIKDAYSDPRFNPSRDKETGYRTTTILCMPIRDKQNQVVAVVQAINKLEGIFTKTDELLLETVAAQSGVAIQRAQLHADDLRNKKRNTALLEVVKAVSQFDGQNLEDLIKTVMITTQKTLGCDKVSLFQVDPINSELVLTVSKDVGARGVRIKMSQGIAGHVASSGEMLNVVDAYLDPRFNQSLDKALKYRTRTILCVPVRDRRRNVVACINKKCGECGSMNCDNHGVEFDSEDSALVNAISAEIASVMQRNQLDTAFAKIVDDESLTEGVRNYIAQYAGSVTDFSKYDEDEIPIDSELSKKIGFVVPSSLVNALHSPQPPGSSTGSRHSSVNSQRVSLTPSNKPSNLAVSVIQEEKTLAETNSSSVRKSPIPSSLKHDHAITISVMEYMSNEADDSDKPISWSRLTSNFTFTFSYEDFCTLEFDYFTNVTSNQFVPLIMLMYEEFRLFSTFHIDPSKMANFIDAVVKNYLPNPYHNFLHAFSVCHVAYNLCREQSISTSLTPIDVLSILTAALCHDLLHPGKNNNFEVNSLSDIAIRYNDSSVLENYHASTCFTILQIPECNIFSGLSKHQYREARANIIDSILHTDMSKHNEIVRELKVKIELNEISNFFSLSSREDRALLRNTIVHSGDLGNPILPFPMYKKWAVNIFEEMFNQSKQEMSLNIPSAFKIERADEKTFCEMQVGFINYIAAPLWSEMSSMIVELRPAYQRMQLNKQRFMELSQEPAAKENIIIQAQA